MDVLKILITLTKSSSDNTRNVNLLIFSISHTNNVHLPRIRQWSPLILWYITYLAAARPLVGRLGMQRLSWRWHWTRCPDHRFPSCWSSSRDLLLSVEMLFCNCNSILLLLYRFFLRKIFSQLIFQYINSFIHWRSLHTSECKANEKFCFDVWYLWTFA